MDLQALIGLHITDILIWIRSIDGVVSENQLYIQFDKSKNIEFPNSISVNNHILNSDIDKKVVSLFTETSYYPICFINSQGKTVKRLKRTKESFSILKLFRLNTYFDKSALLSIKQKKQLKKLKNQQVVGVHLFRSNQLNGCLVLELANGKCLTYTNSVDNTMQNFYGIQLFDDIFEVKNEKGDVFETIEKNKLSDGVLSKASFA